MRQEFCCSYISDRPDTGILEYIFEVASGVFLSFCPVATARYHTVSYGLANFEKLDADFKQKWAAQFNEYA